MTLCFHDFETQSLLDLTIVGTMRYALEPSTRPLLWSWAIDDGEVKLWCPDLSAELAPEVWAYVLGRMAATGPGPQELHDLFAKPDTYAVAHNSGFDRAIWQQIAAPENGFPEIRIEQTLDSQSQFQASNLPGSLEFAGRALGLGQKTIGGKAIMKRFADRALPLPGAAVTVDAAPDRARAIKDALEMWALYLDYSVQDTELMRSVWNVTRPLDLEEWQTYWASERINDRGLPVDIDVCAGAVQYREEEAVHTEAECARITKGAVTRLTLTKQINEWVFDRLPDDLAETMVKARDDDGYVTRLTGDKNIMTRLLEDIAVSDTPPADDVIELLELMQFGRSSSAIKFEKMLNQQVDGRVFGSYVFNGAGQTHRYSARGIQTHNFPRAYLENELDVLDMVAARVPIEQLREHGPVGALLAKLIRPTIVAPLGKVFVWADYSAIEARVTPWLAASRDADATVLELFRRGDDLYTTTAGDIFNVNVAELEEKLAAKDPEAKGMRQASKVACVAEGQLVLTDIGLVPIEDVTLDMLVWDGQSFVSHQGSVFKGYKDVYEYQGLTATVDHIIWTEEAGEVRFGDAIRRREHIVKSGAGRAAVRVVGDNLTGTAVHAAELGDVLRPLPVYWVRGREVRIPGKSSARENAWLPALLAAETNTEVVRPEVDGGQIPLHEPQRPSVAVVRRAWGRVPFQLGAGSGAVGSREYRSAQGTGDRPEGQHSALRAGELTLGDRASTAVEQTRLYNRHGLAVYPERMALRVQHGVPETARGVDTGRDHQPGARRSRRASQGVAYYRGKVAVYDIANAGPNHRFTVSDTLVHNCLALGFLGGVGAYKAMARGYGMRVTDEEGKIIVDGWRERNRWAHRFGMQIEAAAFSALENPHRRYKAGRIEYEFLPNLMKGTLICWLPDGRPLVYPMVKVETQMKFDKPTKVITYMNGMARNSTWRGKLLENAVQSVAAGLLRGAILRLDQEETQAGIVFHTHDEIGGEVDEAEAWPFADRLVETMVRGYDWSEGLPLAAEVEVSYYYTKDEKAAMKRPS